MINYGSGFITIDLEWQNLKQICLGKNLQLQFVQESNPYVDSYYYEIFCIDDSIVYKTIIYNGLVPETSNISQQDNDSNKQDFQQNFLPTANKRLSPATQGSDAALKVSPVGREGSEIVWATHNFCDKTSWYSSSERKTNVLLTSSDNITFYVPNSTKPWVDMYTGKVLHEDNIRDAYGGNLDVIITVDGVTKTMNDCLEQGCENCVGDYTVNFYSGSITFNGQITGSVYASFSEPADAWWILKPTPGSKLSVEGAEMQFSGDVDLKDNIVMEIRGFVQVFAPQYWQGNGGPLPTNYKVTLGQYQYKSLSEFVDETQGAYPYVPQIGGQTRGLKSPMYGMPFAYKTIRELYDSYGMEIRVGLKHNHEFGGSRATATFYCIEKPE